MLCCGLATVSPERPCTSKYCSKHSLDLCLQIDKMVACRRLQPAAAAALAARAN